MSPIEIRVVPLSSWRLLLIFVVAPVGLYLYLGYLPFIIWLVLPIALISLLAKLIRGQSKDPVIILDEHGVFDRRLKVGVIEWDDIRLLIVLSGNLQYAIIRPNAQARHHRNSLRREFVIHQRRGGCAAADSCRIAF